MSRRSADGDGRRVLLLGGTSEIGLAIVRELQARSPREVMLLARDVAAMGQAAADLTEKGCTRVLTRQLDALDLQQHKSTLDSAIAELGGADIVILALGTLGERGGLPSDIAAATEVLQVNAVGAGSLLMNAARYLADVGGGTIVVLSSIAAERSRRANVVYGASKAAIDSLAQGLSDALHEQGVRVMVVRPGFVHTKMTRGIAAAPLATDPREVARLSVDGLERGAQTVWAPSALRYVMLVMRLLPRPIFRRIKS